MLFRSFYAARGYVVLQPEFRGSAGFGDAWFQQNGFKSWQSAVGDVVAAGQWLVKQGIADPSKLGTQHGWLSNDARTWSHNSGREEFK